jgi:hypothetical protein
MFDIRANTEIVAELERITARARAGEIKAIAVTAIDNKHNGDANARESGLRKEKSNE